MEMCAFLRGVNVNGKSMKMSDVCDIFRDEAVQNVRSVLATGNILFDSKLSKSDLRGRLEHALSQYYHSDERLFIKTKEEIGEILTSSPFAPEAELHVYAFICEDGFEAVLMEKFLEITPIDNEKAKINSNKFYWQVSKGATLNAGFSKILAEKKLRNQFTSRNINTIKKVCEKM